MGRTTTRSTDGTDGTDGTGGVAATLARAAALGVAAGGRGSLGVVAPLLARPVPDGPSRTGPRRPGQRGPARQRPALRRLGGALLAVAVVGELVGDKLPSTPSRLDPPGPAVRAASGAAGAVLLARRRHGAGVTVVAACVGAAGALAGTWGGAAWRRLAVGVRPDWPGAVAEDAAALTLAAWALRR
ncbi:hypothetical protein [Cellulosimicrobium marinum]|uniref:hypothetical protein n=1 Tax=Cellulosimicrobium marinum TaxID=1638992 RepID=UPI001E45B811|nr:hypothetical protein [Cellulosimicrobium marinum]MCB7135292.1 hypothetical protein [Cellulosimicrobium marinum]